MTARGEAQAALGRALRYRDEKNCLVWTFAATHGCPMIRTGKTTRSPVRRIVCEDARGSPREGDVAVATCSTPLCISPFHVEWRNEVEHFSEILLSDEVREKADASARTPEGRAARSKVRKNYWADKDKSFRSEAAGRRSKGATDETRRKQAERRKEWWASRTPSERAETTRNRLATRRAIALIPPAQPRTKGTPVE